MTDDELRIAVAQHCFTNLRFDRSLFVGDTPKHDTDFCPVRKAYAVPNYPHDLNAMHDAEETLTDEEHREFREALYCLIMNEADKPFAPGFSTTARNRAYISATARQRAEAFVKVKGTK